MSQFQFSIDRGGTFTDVYAEWKDAQTGETKFRILKLLSVDPEHYPDAPREAIRRVLQEISGVPHPIEAPVDSSRIQSIRMGTTVATNALLERKGERIAFVVTRGFRDLLQIGNQSRPEIFDLRISKPDLLYERVVEVDERIAVLKDGDMHAATIANPASSKHVVSGPIAPYDTGRSEPAVAELERKSAQNADHKTHQLPGKGAVVVGLTGERLRILEALNLQTLRLELQSVYEAGIRSVAVCLMHSYTFFDHELAIGRLAREMGFAHVSLSHECMPMVKMVPRGFTTCADAYLTPAIQRYIQQFTSGFDKPFLSRVKVAFMQSDGGLSSIKDFNGYRAILSGPAGGVVGYSTTTYESNGRQPVIGFDMGGTSTDVSRFDGVYEHVFETVTAGVAIQAPQLDINTVAAGGGSVLFFRSGPICYRRPDSSQLTITDANLYLGRIRTESFPRIFGPKQNEGLDEVATRAAFDKMTAEINAFYRAQAGKQQKDAAAAGGVGVAGGAVGAPITMTAEEVAFGFVKVANEAMCRPIRALTQARGYSITNHVLACFGGAGGQHACALARSLGMKTIYIHRFSGILSAYGIHLADVVSESQEPCTKQYTVDRIPFFLNRMDALAEKASRTLLDQGFAPAHITSRAFLNLRYHGTDTAIMVSLDPVSGVQFGVKRSKQGAANGVAPTSSKQRPGPAPAAAAANGGESKKAGSDGDDKAANRNRRRKEKKKAKQQLVQQQRSATSSASAAASSSADGFKSQESLDEQAAALGGGYLAEFRRLYLREYGFVLHRPVIVDDIRVRAIGHTVVAEADSTADQAAAAKRAAAKSASAAAAQATNAPTKCRVYFEGGWREDTQILNLTTMSVGQKIHGPAVLLNDTSTIVIEPDCTAELVSEGDVRITVGDVAAKATSTELDPVQLSIFGHRFMSIAEQMGRTLQRTAISTNIKERLDFSCALFGPDGGLVANAPHLPVHLGAMQEAVKYQIQAVGTNWRDGDVLVSNHPMAGGSHLPDITVITPVFAPKGSPGSSNQPVFFVASRGHHADIGGISPGSMPPFSKYLYQEGAAIMTFKLVAAGEFDEKGITEILMSPAKFKTGPNETPCSGTRNLHDNLSDLRAQVAANQKGIALMGELIREKTLPVVQAYMYHIQAAAEHAVRATLIDISLAHGLKPVDTVVASDFMDDGTEIRLALTIDRCDGSAKFDFTGTGPQVFGNTNAPKAVTYSAIIYCLRCLVRRDIPLNQGCLNSVSIHIPEGTILNPAPEAAVVGGNVLTSQRVTDVVLQAFQACAASQGCMNNLTFGDETFGYYETIAGGAGAGPGWHGQSGVHTHMTNTRITDPEVLERRYPALLREFSLRPGSGGAGRYRGGDGVVREIEFLRPVTVGILSERRNYHPYGLKGGSSAQCGMNLMLTAQGRTLNLTGKNTYSAQPGDRIRVLSPGGGGFGAPDGSEPSESKETQSSAMHNVATLRTSGSLHAYKQAQESV